MDAWNAGLIQNFRVGSFVLPLDAEESTEAAQVKSVELFGVSAIDSPGLTGIEESGQHYHMVDFQLGDETESSPLPDSFTESSKGGSGLDNPVVAFCINVHRS